MATNKKKRSNRLIYILSGVVLVLLIGLFIGKQQGWIGKPQHTKVATEKAEKRTIIETVSANGKIYPETEVAISPDVSGEVVQLTVEEGDSVKAGVLLAKINPDTYASMVERADAAVNASKSSTSNVEAQITQLQVQLEQARKNHQRNKQLFNDAVISQADLETTETAVKNIEAQIAAIRKSAEGATYNVQSAQASLKEAKENLRRTNVYAPISGVVSQLNIKKGERVVGTSQFSGTELMKLANFNNIEVRVDVSENDIIRVSVGDTAIVEIDAYLNRKFTGLVTHIASSANSINQLSGDQITNFTVKIRLLKESYESLFKEYKMPFRPGMSASVDIQTKSAVNVITVPIQAVTTREIPDSLKKTKSPQATELQELVYVVKDSKVKSYPVKPGIQDNTYIEILEGLQPGDEVVSAPYRVVNKTLKDDMPVEVVDKDKLYTNTSNKKEEDQEEE
ncbi:MAG: efflux RND transporter periplasmic adaptor subunit [Sphingobacteriales bacterium]|nr:MAG: efflux RND transporter periplasmic adaptor subunit [Sphingobacteriales bacterium]